MRKVFKSKEEYLKLPDGDKWEIFKYMMSRITKAPQKKTMSAHATAQKERLLTDTRGNYYPLHTHSEVPKDPTGPSSELPSWERHERHFLLKKLYILCAPRYPLTYPLV